MAFFRAALDQVVSSVVAAAGLTLSGALGAFDDVRVYDGAGQRVPPRGRATLPGCTAGKAGTKWLLGYSLKTGLLEHGLCGAETASDGRRCIIANRIAGFSAAPQVVHRRTVTSETPLWRALVPEFTRGVLYRIRSTNRVPDGGARLAYGFESDAWQEPIARHGQSGWSGGERAA